MSSGAAALSCTSWNSIPDALASEVDPRSRDASYFFFHVPKTGGRTIETHLIERFGEENVFHPKRRRGWLTDLVMHSKFAGNRVAGAGTAEGRHISGHFAPFALLQGRERDYYKACFWRHPAEWFVSLYNYRHFRHADKLKRTFSFGDFRKSMLRNPMTEHFLLYCGGMPGWVYFLMSDRQRFAAACALIERFDTFADIAEVDGFLRSMGYSDDRKPEDQNRIPARQKVLAGLDETARNAIERDNPIDTYLHRLAQGEDREAVRAEAHATLRATFDVRDARRLVALPYYRFKVWVLPFLSAWKGTGLAGSEEGSERGFLWLPVRDPKR